MRFLGWFILATGMAWADAKVSFEKEIEPLLEAYCIDCHGDGKAKGEFSMDEYKDISKHLNDVNHWMAVWRNVRSQIMPPSEKDQLGVEEKKQLLGWIEKEVFKLDPKNPDPGRVTIRRLNRTEYYYAIKDLLGVEYATWESFPADDTGYGFDTIGEVLTISPLHMEKYIEAASKIVELALPKGAATAIPMRNVEKERFHMADDDKRKGSWLPFKTTKSSVAMLSVPASGEYHIHFDFAIRGADEATDQSAHLELWVAGKKIAEQALGWDQSESIRLSGKARLKKADHRVEVKLIAKDPPGENQGEQGLVVRELIAKGPLDGSFKEPPKGYSMIMVDGPAPKEIRDRELYARKIMRSFVSRAFRRPLDSVTVARLVKMAMDVDQSPGRTFEDGIKHAMTAVLASPRFLFRAEIQPEPNNESKVVLLDEYSLAARLSFFLWSSVPDDELLSLAYKKELRKNLGAQIDRMLKDPKSLRFVENFVGQWLQSRDIETFSIDPRTILNTANSSDATKIFNDQVKQDMRKETELFFEFILKNNRPVEELISANYSFLNSRLAKFYGVKGVVGDEHRLVDLTEHPERGGVLTQGTFLVVTSNPTRTSPVKRGLFVLDNLLGTPAPPAPPNVPELEEIAHKAEKPMTMRQMMEVHREKPICAGCHARMDPIGLGLENFNALGQFRLEEKGAKIDSGGQLVTGERFSDVAALKSILADKRRDDFYRCLSEKILTYAIGRGPEYFDAVTIDALVKRLHEKDGSLKELVVGIIESAPFQKRRGD
ncbi:DUF1592 domain-containing protein [Akkermansiaceae bacterium]|nr:DUF1592 domain-containing protein [Akkermansiaceae bacterium]MDB4537644.1 DUF1592 domain-containing protein [Akkermansiaceae bacterium]